MIDKNQYNRELNEIIKFTENYFFFSEINQLAESFNNSRKLAEAVCKLYLYANYGSINQQIQTSIKIGNDNGKDVFLLINGIDYIFVGHNKPTSKLSLERLQHILKSVYPLYSSIEQHIKNLQNAGNTDSHSSGGRHNSTINQITQFKPDVKALIDWIFVDVFNSILPSDIVDLFNGASINIAKRYSQYNDLISQKNYLLNEIDILKQNISNQNKSQILELQIKLNRINIQINLFEIQIKDIVNQFKSGELNNQEMDYQLAYRLFIDDNDINGAINKLNEIKLEETEIKSAKNRLLKAQLHELNSQFDDADRNYKKSIEIYTGFEAIFYYGIFLFNQNRLTDSAKELVKIGFPKDEKIKKRQLDYHTLHIINRTYIILSQIFSQIHCYEDATNCLNIALKIQKSLIEQNPKEIDSHINTLSIQGSLLISLGHPQKAVKYFEKAHELIQIIFPLNSSEYLKSIANLAILYAQLNNLDKAKDCFIQAENILNESLVLADEEKYTKARILHWKGKILNEDSLECFLSSFKLFKQLNSMFFPKLEEEIIILLVDLASSTTDFQKKCDYFNEAIINENQLISIDKNIFIPLFGNLYRLFAIEFIKISDLNSAKEKILKSIELLSDYANKTDRYYELLISSFLYTDLLIGTNENNIKILDNINKCREIKNKVTFYKLEEKEAVEFQLNIYELKYKNT